MHCCITNIGYNEPIFANLSRFAITEVHCIFIVFFGRSISTRGRSFYIPPLLLPIIYILMLYNAFSLFSQILAFTSTTMYLLYIYNHFFYKLPRFYHYAVDVFQRFSNLPYIEIWVPVKPHSSTLLQ